MKQALAVAVVQAGYCNKPEAIMSTEQDRIEKRAQRIRKEEGASHGRNPEDMDPVMLDKEDADTIAANKAISRGGEKEADSVPGLAPGLRLPPG
ncbi:MAG: hypothetical protein FJX25_17660 [Alphaproteobacteria bacterium]|nr:hypothetical protein [Alphaproteobacteria bacterium]